MRDEDYDRAEYGAMLNEEAESRTVCDHCGGDIEGQPIVENGGAFCCEDCRTEYADDACQWDDHDRIEFADPGGDSALRAATPDNPRNLPCPNCGEPDRLTPADRAQGYQCDACARRVEMGF